MPRGIGAYSDAGPLSGNVPPIVIDVDVTPGAAVGAVAICTRPNAAPGMPTASDARTAASAISALFTSLLLLRHPPVRSILGSRRARLSRNAFRLLGQPLVGGERQELRELAGERHLREDLRRGLVPLTELLELLALDLEHPLAGNPAVPHPLPDLRATDFGRRG